METRKKLAMEGLGDFWSNWSEIFNPFSIGLTFHGMLFAALYLLAKQIIKMRHEQ